MRNSFMLPEVEPPGIETTSEPKHQDFESVLKFELDRLAVILAHVHQEFVHAVQGDLAHELIGGVAQGSVQADSNSRRKPGSAGTAPASEEDGVSVKSDDSDGDRVRGPPGLSQAASDASRYHLPSRDCSNKPGASRSFTAAVGRKRDSIPMPVSGSTSSYSLFNQATGAGGHVTSMIGAPPLGPKRDEMSSQSIVVVNDDFLERKAASLPTSKAATPRATQVSASSKRRSSSNAFQQKVDRSRSGISTSALSSAASSRASLSKGMRRGSGRLLRARSSLVSDFSTHSEYTLSAQDWIKGKLKDFHESVYKGSFHQDHDEDEPATRFSLFMQMLITSPGSVRHCLWESLVVLIVFCEVIVLPLQLIEPPRDSYLNVGSDYYSPNIRTIVACFWTLNLPVAFTTGTMNAQGEVFMLPLPIALHYATSWMGLDLLTVTLDWLDVAGALGGNWLGVARLIRMLRGIRLVQVLASQDMARPLARSEMLRLVATIVTLMATMAWTTHVIGCAFYYVGTQPNQDTDGWVVQAGAHDMSLGDRYTWCFHCALGLFVGEHIVWPSSHVERTFTVAVLFFTFIISASFVSSLTTAMTRLHLITSQRSKQRTSLNRYLIENKISQQLSLKVRRNAQHAAEQLSMRTPEESVELLTFVSGPLRQEINFEIFGKVLCAHPFFEFYADMHPVAIRKICHVAVKRISFSRGDVVFSDQEVPAEPRMYFVLTGCLEYLQLYCGMLEVVKIRAGNWLCEPVLWAKWKHCGTATATCETDICALSTVGFHMVVGEFPHAELHAYARSFVDAIRQGKQLTDASIGTSKLTLLAGAAFQLLGDDGFELRERPRQAIRPQVPGEPASILPEQLLAKNDGDDLQDAGSSHSSQDQEYQESPVMRIDDMH